MQDVFRSAEWRLRIDDPILPTQLVEKSLNLIRITQMLQASTEDELALLEGDLQAFPELAAEYPTEYTVPSRTWIIMRSLSMLATFKRHNFARRSPVAYSVMKIVRCIRFLGESISSATSSGLSTVGNRLARFANGI